MPKQIKNIFDSKLSYMNLYEAHLRASKHKRKRRDVMIFEMDLETNLMNLYHSIKNGTYHRGKYHEFTVYEPKERIIQSLPYIDRIVHQWYVEEFIIPYIAKKFIKDTYACIRGKGTHKAVDALQHDMRIMKRRYGHYYVLKCDIRKYFYTIDKDILFSILKHHIADKKLLEFTKSLIYDNDNSKGIPIGNYTSQYFANIYLNELDHYVKETLRIKYYIRYMDDFIILVPTKEEASHCKKLITHFLNKKLALDLNKKSKYYPNELGVDFCGYRVYETHRLIRKRSKKKIKKLIKKANIDFSNQSLDYQKVRMCYNSWKAHASHANTYRLVSKYHDMFLFKEYL